MSSKADRTLVEALGVLSDDTTKVSFTDTATSGILDANSTYRLASTEDCYIKFAEAGDSNVDSGDTLLFGGIPEIFQTTANNTSLGVIRKDTSGDLHCTRMKTPGK